MTTHQRTVLAIGSILLAATVVGCGKTAEPASSGTAASTAAVNVSDVDVAEHVKTALQQAESLKSADITVVSTKGDVLLTGMVDSQVQIDEAVRIAKAADGAHAVHNELTLKK